MGCFGRVGSFGFFLVERREGDGEGGVEYAFSSVREEFGFFGGGGGGGGQEGVGRF